MGFYIGELALGSSVSLDENEAVRLDFASHNPAIFVPRLKKVIYGMESWWGEIESVEELKAITNEDINNVWYVKLMKEMMGKEEANNG